jgi:hypothetical protein
MQKQEGPPWLAEHHLPPLLLLLLPLPPFCARWSSQQYHHCG